MSKYGLKIARLFGRGLPAFKNQSEAEKHLYRERDDRIKKMVSLAPSSDEFAADFTPESLKGLELWYFELWENNGFRKLRTSREDFERNMAMYFFEVAVRNCPEAEWEVAEYGFEKGKYEIGVVRGRSHLMRSRFTDHFNERNNKRRQKIYRNYREHYGG